MGTNIKDFVALATDYYQNDNDFKKTRIEVDISVCHILFGLISGISFNVTVVETWSLAEVLFSAQRMYLQRS